MNGPVAGYNAQGSARTGGCLSSEATSQDSNAPLEPLVLHGQIRTNYRRGVSNGGTYIKGKEGVYRANGSYMLFT